MSNKKKKKKSSKEIKTFTLQDIANAYHKGWMDKEDGEPHYAFGDDKQDIKSFKGKIGK